MIMNVMIIVVVLHCYEWCILFQIGKYMVWKKKNNGQCDCRFCDRFYTFKLYSKSACLIISQNLSPKWLCDQYSSYNYLWEFWYGNEISDSQGSSLFFLILRPRTVFTYAENSRILQLILEYIKMEFWYTCFWIYTSKCIFHLFMSSVCTIFEIIY